jgi:hypothetical protein
MGDAATNQGLRVPRPSAFTNFSAIEKSPCGGRGFQDFLSQKPRPLLSGYSVFPAAQ